MKSKLEEVENQPYTPTFGRNQKGMVAGPELEKAEQTIAAGMWSDAHKACVRAAKELAELGVSKQWANRLLEPFAYQKVLVTATDFSNFFRLRCADDAQPEIQELAVKMAVAMARSTPKELAVGDWHRPYYAEEDGRLLQFMGQIGSLSGAVADDRPQRLSAARAARVSYGTHDGKRDLDADLRLAQTLQAEGHSNPFEAVATPATDTERYANLKGWISYRYKLEQEGRLPSAEG